MQEQEYRINGRKVEDIVKEVDLIKVTWKDRFCMVGAFVLGDEVLLGCVPLEDMDLIVNTARHRLEVNPLSPNIPHARVK